jgi:hypothetical protein
MTDPRYPIGPFQMDIKTLAGEERKTCIAQIAESTAKLREALKGLSPAQLDTPYRPGGWTARQVAHHLADSHLNGYVRFKLALTEEEPTLKTYEEAEWAKLADVHETPIEVSVDLLDALHRRWVVAFRSLSEKDFARTARHPQWGSISVDFLLAQYAWHGRHHVAHITSLRDRQGWN